MARNIGDVDVFTYKEEREFEESDQDYSKNTLGSQIVLYFSNDLLKRSYKCKNVHEKDCNHHSNGPRSAKKENIKTNIEFYHKAVSVAGKKMPEKYLY